MNRKANRTVPLSWIVTVFVLVAAVGGSIYAARALLSDPYRSIPELPVSLYLTDSLSFRGNIYKVAGRVENQLVWSDKSGRLFSFATEGQDSHVAVLLPVELNSFNVQKGQSFEIKVKVADKGLLEAVQMRKS